MYHHYSFFVETIIPVFSSLCTTVGIESLQLSYNTAMPVAKVPLENGEFYHVYNRGVDKRIVFVDTQDYLRFYQSLAFFNNVEPTVRFETAQYMYKRGVQPLVKIHAYALLHNHYHLLIEQCVDGGLSEFMKRVSTGYTSYFNERNDRTGTLFQGRFKRSHVNDDNYRQYLIAYINENHLVHNMPEPTQVYETSKFHYDKRFRSILLSNEPLFSYDRLKSEELARDIHSRRQELKYMLHEI
jgi:REP element-mobilizing transposase RayT